MTKLVSANTRAPSYGLPDEANFLGHLTEQGRDSHDVTRLFIDRIHHGEVFAMHRQARRV